MFYLYFIFQFTNHIIDNVNDDVHNKETALIEPKECQINQHFYSLFFSLIFNVSMFCVVNRFLKIYNNMEFPVLNTNVLNFQRKQTHKIINERTKKKRRLWQPAEGN